MAARKEGGPYRDLFDFCERVDLTCVNKGVIEALIKSGALDRFGERNQLLENVEELLRYELQRRQVDLRVDCAPQLPPLAADPDGLQQVLVNHGVCHGPWPERNLCQHAPDARALSTNGSERCR